MSSGTEPLEMDKHDEIHEEVVVDRNARFGGLEARKKLEKRLLWKVDARMSILLVIYILNYIDRNNAAAARLKGFEDDLKLEKDEFPTILSILYVGYILMQVPSNMLLNKIGRPSLYIPACMLVWGTISVLTGITTNFVGALLTRFFLGFVEAAFLPGALFLISKWYKREELGLRNALLFCGNIISNAFGSLIASGILSNMEGKLGHRAWRWLFYIEGALTMAVAVLAIFVLPDFPSTSRWLTEDEKALAILRMEEDVGVADDKKKEEQTGAWQGLKMAVLDWRVWWMAMSLTSIVISLSFNAFFPTLTATLGYGPTETLLLCAPPWIFSTIVCFCLARHSDKTQDRFFHIAGAYVVGIVGFVIAISTMNTAARYVSLFLMASMYSGFIVFYAWISNSFPRPTEKRAVVLALTNAFSQLGNVAGSYIWSKQWGPTYRYSYGICIATAGLALVMCFAFRMELQRQNKKLEREEEQEDIDGIEPEREVARGFRYIL
ncbi:sugar transporter [Cylindrobasidium torrendii FP15055 ss-10]|uniref:Sugar transporter n=1 Tax=Cylindrobasidium torrendii FP15055 ss-10 TaxID=1314674 RepID=A0A0D7B046_9AGAR|nr:sugar transporter [Cylindrobasidium torrendii FP15055 ss-10]